MQRLFWLVGASYMQYYVKADIVATKMFSNGDEYKDDVYEQEIKTC